MLINPLLVLLIFFSETFPRAIKARRQNLAQISQDSTSPPQKYLGKVAPFTTFFLQGLALFAYYRLNKTALFRNIVASCPDTAVV